MQVFTYPHMVIRVHYPDITQEERNRRMKQIYKAAENVLKAKEKGERREANQR